jgi:hypothetical protein
MPKSNAKPLNPSKVPQRVKQCVTARVSGAVTISAIRSRRDTLTVRIQSDPALACIDDLCALLADRRKAFILIDGIALPITIKADPIPH